MERYSFRIVSRQNVVATVVGGLVLGYIAFGAVGIVLARAWWALILVVIAAVLLIWYLLPCVYAIRAEVVFGPGGIACRQGPNTWRLAWRDIDRVAHLPGRLALFPVPNARPTLGRGGYRVSAYLYPKSEKASRDALYVPLRADHLIMASMVLNWYLGPSAGRTTA